MITRLKIKCKDLINNYNRKGRIRNFLIKQLGHESFFFSPKHKTQITSKSPSQKRIEKEHIY